MKEIDMSLDDFKQRYLYIAKNSLKLLKEKGFKKKGMRYSKENGELILEIFSAVSRPWINSESLYEFEISWELKTINPKFIQLYMLMEGEKNITKAPLLWSMVLPETYERGMLYLHNDDLPGQDEQFIDEIKRKIEAEVIPWFNNLTSIDDIMHITEEEYKLERGKRKFFRHTNIYYALANFYATKGWKDKTLETIEQAIEKMPITVRDLVEKRRNKYIKYFERSDAKKL